MGEAVAGVDGVGGLHDAEIIGAGGALHGLLHGGVGGGPVAPDDVVDPLAVRALEEFAAEEAGLVAEESLLQAGGGGEHLFVGDAGAHAERRPFDDGRGGWNGGSGGSGNIHAPTIPAGPDNLMSAAGLADRPGGSPPAERQSARMLGVTGRTLIVAEAQGD